MAAAQRMKSKPVSNQALAERVDALTNRVGRIEKLIDVAGKLKSGELTKVDRSDGSAFLVDGPFSGKAA